MSLTTEDKQDIKSMLDTSIKAGIAHLPTVQMVRDIVKDETAHLPTVQNVRDIVHEEIYTVINPLDERVGRLEESAADTKIELYKLGVLIEDSNSRIATIAEAVDKNLKLNTKVNNHGLRLEEIESKQPMIIDTLSLHSKQLGS